MPLDQTVPNGVVIATEKKLASILIDESSLEKVSVICPTVGAVFSGMSPDARLLVAKARKAAQKYFQTYQEYPPVSQLVREIASVMQEYTQSG
jgi:20S proteasome subunit alpha 2